MLPTTSLDFYQSSLDPLPWQQQGFPSNSNNQPWQQQGFPSNSNNLSWQQQGFPSNSNHLHGHQSANLTSPDYVEQQHPNVNPNNFPSQISDNKKSS